MVDLSGASVSLCAYSITQKLWTHQSCLQNTDIETVASVFCLEKIRRSGALAWSSLSSIHVLRKASWLSSISFSWLKSQVSPSHWVLHRSPRPTFASIGKPVPLRSSTQIATSKAEHDPLVVKSIQNSSSFNKVKALKALKLDLPAIENSKRALPQYPETWSQVPVPGLFFHFVVH